MSFCYNAYVNVVHAYASVYVASPLNPLSRRGDFVASLRWLTLSLFSMSFCSIAYVNVVHAYASVYVFLGLAIQGEGR